MRTAVNKGAVGASRSGSKPLVLIQVDDMDGSSQSRAAMTLEEAEMLVEDLQEQIAEVRRDPSGVEWRAILQPKKGDS